MNKRLRALHQYSPSRAQSYGIIDDHVTYVLCYTSPIGICCQGLQIWLSQNFLHSFMHYICSSCSRLTEPLFRPKHCSTKQSCCKADHVIGLHAQLKAQSCCLGIQLLPRPAWLGFLLSFSKHERHSPFTQNNAGVLHVAADIMKQKVHRGPRAEYYTGYQAHALL
ncbi:hypothetical protein ABBQ32_14164 [Trebouxia sp. C0010 RCD-2024]